jgi:hypothetical protein
VKRMNILQEVGFITPNSETIPHRLRGVSGFNDVL